MPKSINTSPQVLPVPDEALLELAELALVPPEQRELFFEFIRTNLDTAWELDGLIKNGLASKRREKLVHAALTLYDTLGNLNKNERALIGRIFGGEAKFLFDRISSEGMTGLDQTAYQLALLFSLMTGKPPPRYPSQLPETPSRGRRAGTVKNWIFQNFVLDLLISTTTAGGSFTFAKETSSGTLVKAIRMLAHHLPEGVGPRSLSGSTLQRLVDRCTRLKKEAAELECDLPIDLL
jgi:hypothetical protein